MYWQYITGSQIANGTSCLGLSFLCIFNYKRNVDNFKLLNLLNPIKLSIQLNGCVLFFLGSTRQTRKQLYCVGSILESHVAQGHAKLQLTRGMPIPVFHKHKKSGWKLRKCYGQPCLLCEFFGSSRKNLFESREIP